MSIETGTLPVLHQSETSECGLVCIAMILGYFGKPTDVRTLRRHYGVGIRGTNLSTLVKIAADLGFKSRALRFSYQALGTLRTPCILHWGLDHFVVLKSVSPRAIAIHDPALGFLRISRASASEFITGVALEVTPIGNLASFGKHKSLKLWHLVSHVEGLRVSIAELIVWTGLLQICVAAIPWLLQVALDATTGGREFHNSRLIAIALVSIVLLRVTVEALRLSLSSYLSATLGVESRADLFAKLHQLPVEFFQRQSIAMLMARFQTLTDLTNLNTEGAISIVLDGAMCVGGIAFLGYYNIRLGSLASTLFLCQIAISLFAVKYQRRAMFGVVTTESRASGVLLDSLRSISTTKISGNEHQRLARYLNSLIRAARSRTQQAAIFIGLSNMDTLLTGARMAIVILLGVDLVLKNKLSVGSLFAFSAYQELIASHLKGLLTLIGSYAGARTQLDMIDEIISAEPEKYGGTGDPIPDTGSALSFGLSTVAYRFSPSDPLVFSSIDLDVAAGECVAIIGPSGGGKSTLLRIMMGLSRPSIGALLVGGVDPWSSDIRHYRRSIAAVMQDDQLFTGSIRDNIAGGDVAGDGNRILEAAKKAQLSSDVASMPMGYYTAVGDMGCALSAGQKQRLLLARALYREPKVLFLDEATGNVDCDTEEALVRTIGSLHMTRIVVTHRPAILQIAHRVYELRDRRLVRVQSESQCGSRLRPDHISGTEVI